MNGSTRSTDDRRAPHPPRPVPIDGSARSRRRAVPGLTLLLGLATLAACDDGIIDPPPADESGWSAVTSGAQHACALWGDGVPYCWGDNQSGQLGLGSLDVTRATRPTAVDTERRFVDLQAGASHTCGLDESGTVWCWGENSIGQLGKGDDVDATAPTPIASDQTFESLTVGAYHGCGVSSSGQAFCWGGGSRSDGTGALALGFVPPDNCASRLGLGAYISDRCSLVPRPVEGGHTFRQLSAGLLHSCGLTSAGRALCWGWNRGMLGNGEDYPQEPGTPQGYAEPQPVAGDFTFEGIAAGNTHTCAWTGGGVGYCWGGDIFGEIGHLGTGDADPHLVPELVDGEERWVSLVPSDQNSIHSQFTCGLSEGGEAWCWGGNRNSQLGAPSPDLYGAGGEQLACALSPQAVTGDRSYRSLGTGREFACATGEDGTGWCWGLNDAGQLGNGGSVNASLPTRVLDPEPEN